MPKIGLSRRRFIQWGAGSLLALSPLAYATRVFEEISQHFLSQRMNRIENVANYEWKVLTRREAEFLMGLADTIIPPPTDSNRDPLPAAHEVGVIPRIDMVLAEKDKRSQFQAALAIEVLIVRHYVHDTFSRSSARWFEEFKEQPYEYRSRYFESLEHHRISHLRKAAWAMKKLVTVGYFSSPEVWEAMNYKGPYRNVSAMVKTPLADALTYEEFSRLAEADLHIPTLENDPIGEI